MSGRLTPHQPLSPSRLEGEIIQPVTLPAPQTDIQEQVRVLAKKMTAKTWEDIKADLLAMLAGA